MWKKLSKCAVWLSFAIWIPSLGWGFDRPLYFGYFKDTLGGLSCLRGEKGLIRDEVVLAPPAAPIQQCRITGANETTSATNIALDLLTRIAAGDLAGLDRILRKLQSLQVHPTLGLFFSWYSTTGTPVPINRAISSVDNMHLALALWVIAHEFPGAWRAHAAQELYSRMDFTPFYRTATGLFAGSMSYHPAEPGGEGEAWSVDTWNYSYFGSEARSIYALAWALGWVHDRNFLAKAFSNLVFETFPWMEGSQELPILRTWNGGAFQLLLPEMLLKESRYSSRLRDSARNYAHYILAEQKRLGLPVPAAFSASDAGIMGESCGERSETPCYVGAAGSPSLVATMDQDLENPVLRAQWDAVFTPHAAFLAAQVAPELLEEPLMDAEKLQWEGEPLYRKGLGWFDGYRVKAPSKGAVVHSMLSLDQGMIALSIAQILAPDGMGPSARALFSDPRVRERLREFYSLVDRHLAPRSSLPESRE